MKNYSEKDAQTMSNLPQEMIEAIRLNAATIRNVEPTARLPRTDYLIWACNTALEIKQCRRYTLYETVDGGELGI